MSRGHGFGFYFLSGGFYPDFMLWVKNKKTNEQYLSFIDPHGLRNEQLKWDSPKINLYKTIKGLEKKLSINNFSLNSFILQPPPDNLQDAGLDGWHREDDPKREIPLDDYAANKHVYAIPIDGNKSGPDGYIDKIITQILTPAPKTFKYFAYGSNMSSRRLLSRCSSANFIEVAKVEGYTLSFNKKSSVDKSGKANITQTGKNTDIVWGVIFEIEESQKSDLEKAEGKGKGYDEQTIKVTDSKGHTHDCIAYIATEAKYLTIHWFLWTGIKNIV
jgi:AIG2-like family.